MKRSKKQSDGVQQNLRKRFSIFQEHPLDSHSSHQDIDFDKFIYNNAFKSSGCFKLKGKQDSTENVIDRTIISNRVDYDLADNSIQTSKYTLVNFIPKNLYIQFSKRANIYFLFIGVMQIIPEITISGGTPIIFLPLAFIIIISLIKDVFEDYKRKQSDFEENSKKVQVYSKGEGFIPQQWKALRPGNIIMLNDEEQCPADILVLSTSQKKGMCYIETKNLDGETNLKNKIANKDLQKLFNMKEVQSDINYIEENKIKFQFQKPNIWLYQFNGVVFTKQRERIPIENNNIILRGCSLKNTGQIIGFVAYTGHDTKVMMNHNKTRQKKSNLETIMNKQIHLIFYIQVFLCLFCSIYYVIWYKKNTNSLPYLEINKDQNIDNAWWYNFFVRYGNWTLMFTNFVPISLLVTLEMVQFIQAYLINFDKDMIDSVQQKPSLVQSSNLNQEIGQIKHIFSDKTGTLTCNIMEFKKITINGISYGSIKPDNSNLIDKVMMSRLNKVTNVDFQDKCLIDVLNDPKHEENEYVMDCLFLCAICHSIVIKNNAAYQNVLNQKNNQNGLTVQDFDNIEYSASSPDELALANFARFCGVFYLGQDAEGIILVKFKDTIYNFKFLHELTFTSSRKRQSVIFQDLKDNKIYLYCKGADSILEKRLNKHSNFIDKTYDDLSNYARDGLRTLVLAKRVIPKSEYEFWAQRYEEAKIDIQQREEKIYELEDEIEHNLELIGATAIEDKLQEDVVQTIQCLKKADIKVWVLTGDKIETAINVGQSCSLLTSNMKRHILEGEQNINEIDNRLDQIVDALPKSHQQTEDFLDNNIPHALIISGEALMRFHLEKLSKKLVQITKKCSVVLCCRVLPKQKSDIVQLVRKMSPDIITLAIGDGANDVNMINSAHVGVGIRGVEGQQAARASDFVIGEFRLLRKLLFYHGRENYRRNSYLVLYNFYKNTLLVLPQFWYGIVNSFSGQTLYDSIIYQLFNIFYTSLPIMIFAILDKEELDDKKLIENTERNYYQQGMQNKLFNVRKFWMWFINGAYQALIISMFSLYSLEYNFSDPLGYTSNFWDTGLMIFGLVVLVSNLKIMIFSNTNSILGFLIWIFGLISYWLSIIVVSQYYVKSYNYLNYQRLITNWRFNQGNFLIVVATCMVDYALFVIQTNSQQQKELQERIDQEIMNNRIDHYQRDLFSNPSIRHQNDYELNEMIAKKLRQQQAKRFDVRKLSKKFTNNNDVNQQMTLEVIRNENKHRGFAFSRDDAIDQEEEQNNNNQDPEF